MSVHPGYWMHETTGVLRPAVEAYLAGGPMTLEQRAAVRVYLRQWINASCWDENPWSTPDNYSGLRRLRSAVDYLFTREAIQSWIDDAVELGLDPL